MLIFSEEVSNLKNLVPFYNKQLETQRLIRLIPLLAYIPSYEGHTDEEIDKEIYDNFGKHPILWSISAIVTLPISIFLMIYSQGLNLINCPNSYNSGRLRPIFQLMHLMIKLENMLKSHDKNLLNPEVQKSIQKQFDRCENKIINFHLFLLDDDISLDFQDGIYDEILISTVNIIKNKLKIFLKDGCEELRHIYGIARIVSQGLRCTTSQFFKLPEEIGGKITAFAGINKKYFTSNELENLAIMEIENQNNSF